MSKAICAFGNCGCSIINLNDDKIIQLPGTIFETLHLMQRKQSADIKEGSTTSFLITEDVWDFDNIGVSKDLMPGISEELNSRANTNTEVSFQHDGNLWYIKKCEKYLICGDCDRGPIGMVCMISQQDDQERRAYLLSLGSLLCKDK
ncbi:hypothetical protein NCAS_0B04640 [Naumovozyma castellii]|uniref:Uncharacterized protein n=1 Tax=Naumovozyma castellii TaxID=27288 RepID=G0VAM2_NAUCA|nr:hypothetical protein NCAS_0B04640 [Naumovozyma castellii CBS 4309]CCC68548.1 hypothetical protein NCAS_0B04640 [Naumovozyma castellii CBS 4309]